MQEGLWGLVGKKGMESETEELLSFSPFSSPVLGARLSHVGCVACDFCLDRKKEKQREKHLSQVPRPYMAKSD